MLGRRETSIVLCSALLRGAGLDWYEQGDVWAKFAQLRPSDPSHAISNDRAATLAAAMRRLMTVDARAVYDSNDGPLAGAEEWVTAFERAGQALRTLDQHGRLDRGLRAVLAHHVIFHANRAGMPAQDQATLAHLAIHTVFATPFRSASTRADTPTTDKVNEVTNVNSEADLSAEQLRDHLVDRLRENGAVRSPQVEQALRQVPRHMFVPGVPLDQAYADEAVYTKSDAAGTSISAASQPWIVAMMLEQLKARRFAKSWT
jgi:protein-L-isoaspartate(D-aspartate) O-methyltransferase